MVPWLIIVSLITVWMWSPLRSLSLQISESWNPGFGSLLETADFFIMYEPELLTRVNDTMRRDAEYFTDECSEELGQMSGRCIDIGTGAGDVSIDFILPKLNPNSTLLCEYQASSERLVRLLSGLTENEEKSSHRFGCLWVHGELWKEKVRG